MPPQDRRPASQAPESFGRRLRRLREAAGLTQEELAERSGLTAHGISALERGARSRPYPHTVRALATALELSGAERQMLASAVPPRGPVEEAGATVPRAPGATGSPVDRSTVSTVRGVPAEVTPLLGREHDVTAVVALLRRTTSRLVTLTGTGGVGKTRLAFAVAEAAAAEHRDGAVVVPLAGLDDPALVLPLVGRAVGVQAVEAEDADAGVLAALGTAQVLLVLDNLEHLAGVNQSVARLLAACPGVVVLATSRAALRLRGESEYVVHPLALPVGAVRNLGDVASSPAGALLLDRARAVSPSFGGQAGDPPVVAALCERLAGIPLALELAAARARVLDARTLLARLDDAMSRSGASDLPARQRTMRATLDWSYRLLTAEEQTLLRRLSVFHGGCDLDAVEAVGADLADVLGSLERLVEHSLVVVTEEGDGARRYGMLEPVLQHTRSLLRREDEASARTAHARHYLAFAEQAASHYERAEQVHWLDRAERDDANLAAAVEWFVEVGDGERAGAMAWALWLYWWLHGHLRRGRRLAEAALETSMGPTVRVRTLLTAAAMAFAQGDHDTSGPRWARAEELAVRSGDQAGRLNATAGLGLVALAEGRLTDAEGYFTASLVIGAEVGSAGEWVVALTHVWLGTVHLLAGDPVGAVEQVRRGLASARRRGDRLTTYVALYNLVQAELAHGAPEEARQHLLEGIELSEQTGDVANLSFFLESLAVVEVAAGEHARAAVLLGASGALRDAVGSAVYGYYLPDPHLRHRAEEEAVTVLGTEQYDAGRQAGAALGPARAVAYAMEGAAV